ncbi:Hypothetical predicted protein [Cloeon dipterum]|uniref:Uncharacterized protein n=1 Tax=Cloeon dipterum TaxID=197152 RepID=A0A8S1DYJ2_9INSE|nr:Hypothetical predicted protein [Cloeon dipterum]
MQENQQIAEFFRDQFFSLFKTRQKHERKLKRNDYINEQVWTSLCRVLKVEKDYELSAPDVAACIEHIITNVLPTIFVQKFQKPTTEQLDSGVQLAYDKVSKEKRVALLELQYLEALARMTSTLNKWLFYFQVKEMICQLQNPNYDGARVPVQPQNQLTRLPAGDTVNLYSQLKNSLDQTTPDCQSLDTKRFFNLMQNYEMEGQMRYKNANELKCKLGRMEMEFQTQREKSLAMLRDYTEELEGQKEKLQSMKLVAQVNADYRTNSKKNSAEERDELVTVISLFENVLHTSCQTLRPTQMISLLERKLQSMQNEIFHLRRGISATEQVILEKEWIAKERSRLKHLAKMHSVQKRAERLAKRSQLALLQRPEKITIEHKNYFVKEPKKKARSPPVEVDHRRIEELVCFDERCGEKLFVQIYEPLEKASESNSKEDQMLTEWIEVKKNGPS